MAATSKPSQGCGTRRPVGDTAQVADDHAEAVVQRDGDDHAVAMGRPHGFRYKKCVVQDIVVAQGSAFQQARGALRVLNVDRDRQRRKLIAPFDELLASIPLESSRNSFQVQVP